MMPGSELLAPDRTSPTAGMEVLQLSPGRPTHIAVPSFSAFCLAAGRPLSRCPRSSARGSIVNAPVALLLILPRRVRPPTFCMGSSWGNDEVGVPSERLRSRALPSALACDALASPSGSEKRMREVPGAAVRCGTRRDTCLFVSISVFHDS